MNKLNYKLFYLGFLIILFLSGNNPILGQGYNILTIGDDITVSTSSLYGYRYHLSELLIADGVDFDMVGTQTDNDGGNPAWPNPFDSDHEAYMNYESYELGRQLPLWLPNYTADIALIHVGSIDLNHGLQNPAWLGLYPPRVYKWLKGIVTKLSLMWQH